MTISIIVDNYNRSYLLPLVMRSYCREEFTKDEVEMIIVDDDSPPDDHFVEYLRLGLKTVKPFFKVRAFETHKSLTLNVGGTTNIGVKKSRGNLLILNHSDMIPYNPDILRLVWSRHQETPNLYLASRLLELSLNDKWLLPAGASMIREIYEEAGGHDEMFRGSGSCTDTDFLWRITGNAERMGWVVRTDPEITYLHLKPADIGLRTHYEALGVTYEEISRRINREKGFLRVNPNGWGICETLEEVEL